MVRVRVPLWGSSTSQNPTMKVRMAQTSRRTTLPIVVALNAAATMKTPMIIRIQPTKIAVPTEATAG